MNSDNYFIYDNNLMDLPPELWGLIAYELKFELDLYKHCNLVNKQLHNIINQLYNRIQNNIRIVTGPRPGLSRNGFEVIDHVTITPIDRERNHDDWWCTSDNFILNKNELLSEKKYYLIIRDAVITYYYIFTLNIKNCLNKELNQMCDYIELDSVIHPSPSICATYYKCIHQLYSNKTSLYKKLIF